MGKRPRKGGDERDAFCDCSYHRRYHGHRAEIKRMVRRRERRQYRQARSAS